MEKIDFSNYTFRCSSLPTLMVNSRTKGEPLSETAKACLEEIWIREIFGREKFDTSNKYTEKGVLCEPDSMDLVQKVTKETYFKNKKRFYNEFINGEPDIILSSEQVVKDIKSSWNIWTYASVDRKKAVNDYYWQMLGYMWLTGSKVGELIYCLVNTPEEIMNNELYKLSFKYPDMNESDEKAEKYRKNYVFDDIPPELRMKTYLIERDEDAITLLKERLVAARSYLATLSL